MLVGTRSRASLTRRRALDPESILLHEYTHHFMFQYFPATYPTWYSEGYRRVLGRDPVPRQRRRRGRRSRPSTASRPSRSSAGCRLSACCASHNYSEAPGENVFLLYAEGWLLVRYMFEHPERQRQLEEYLSADQRRRQPTTQAVRQAFPDIGRFNDELYNYAGAARYNVVRLPFRTIDIGQIMVRTLRSGRAGADRRTRSGSARATRSARPTQFAADVAGGRRRFPDDPFAIRMVMEGAVSGRQQLRGGRRAADRLLRSQPEQCPRAGHQGAGPDRRACGPRSSTDRAAWDAAAPTICPRASTRAPTRSDRRSKPITTAHAAQGVLPPDDAQNALYDAHELAPSDAELRYKLALDFEQRGMIPRGDRDHPARSLSTPHPPRRIGRRAPRRREREDRTARPAGTRTRPRSKC